MTATLLALLFSCSVKTVDEPVVDDDAGAAAPVELSPDLCEAPEKMALVMEALKSAGGSSPSFGRSTWRR